MPPATFSAVEFRVLWSELGLGPPPSPLTGSSDPVDAERAAKLLAGLAARGIVTGTRVDREWADRLAALARPDRSVEAVGVAGYRFRALAATAHGTAVLAVGRDDGVVVGPIREGSLVASVVALLPGSPPGPGRALSVPVAAVRRFLDADHADVDADLADAGVDPADAGVLVRLAEDRVRGGRFCVTVAASDGRPRRRLPVVSWFDTSLGRYVMTTDGSALSIAPADAARIAVRLHEILDDATR